MDSSRKHVNVSPEEKASFLSKLFYWWFLPFFKFGYINDVEMKDVYNTANVDLSGSLGDALQRNWEIELRNYNEKKKQKASFKNAIFKTFWKPFLLAGAALFIQFVIIKSLQPLVLAEFIRYFSSEKEEHFGWIWGSCVVLMSFTSIVITHSTNLATQRVGMRVRIAVCSLVYRKILKLNHSALGETTVGQLVNLLSNDVQRFDIASPYLHFLWIMPICSTITFFILYYYVGIVPALTAMTFIGLQIIPLQAFFSKWQGKMRYKIAVRTDTRVKLMNEITSGIQVIKMYAWEKPFEKVVELYRKLEIDEIAKSSHVYGFLSAMGIFTERFIVYITLIAFVLVGNRLSGEVVFALVLLFNQIQAVVAIHFPRAVAFYSESKVSISRLENFLLLEENEKIETAETYTDQVGDIKLTNATASWKRNTIVPTLANVNLHIQPGTLCCVVGNVGCGKSTLLKILLKELPLTSGTVEVSGDVAYASQEPWLFVSNVRDNILFGKSYISTRYKEVVRVCSLERDFKQFPFGDKTLVGERGVSLSGGQRARVNLARAVYTDADIYLFDDPLSAVDTKVGRHLFDECIVKYLRNKTRMLVTHQLQFMKMSDLIVIINNGRVEKVAKFNELSENDLKIVEKEPDTEEMNEEKERMPDNYEYVVRRKSTQINFQSALSLAASLYSVAPEETEELIEKGAVSNSTYLEYWLSGASKIFLLFTCFVFIISQMVTNASDLWLTYWSNEEAKRNYPNLTESRVLNMINVKYDQDYYIWIYSVLILASVILLCWRSFLYYQICMSASKVLHSKMFSNVIKAPMRFFDTNPSGRILNRFSKDMGAIDELLPRCTIDALQIFMVMGGILMLVFIVTPWMMIPSVVLAIPYWYIRVIYLRSAQSVKRLEGVTKAPLFSHIVASLYGLTTIRVNHAEEMLSTEFDVLQDQHTSTWFVFLVSSTAFGFYLDILSLLFLAFVTVQFLLLGKENTVSGNVGLVVSTSINLTNMVQIGMRQSAEVSSNMISVERVLQYTKLQPEGPSEYVLVKKPPQDWPSQGRIRFSKMYLRYDTDLPPVLRDLNIQVNSGEKVGIVGRTGAGKSTLIASLFRLAPIDGTISIDDVDTQEIDLHDLRTNISIIPQEPVLFSASIRYNLDPFEKHTDDVIWKALENVELKDAITDLDQPVSEGGSNFSAGQRQLICLARAIVRNNKILVMDEATANVDPHTDALIQRTIRERFKDCTVLTIAHRLNTVMDSDRVLVIDAGEAVEFDHPHTLLENPESFFSKMVEETGPIMENVLKNIARDDYNKKRR